MNIPIKTIVDNGIKLFVVKQKETTLKEVVVLSKQVKLLTIGIKSRSPFLSGTPIISKSHDIVEFAQLIDIDKKPSSIESVSIFFLTSQKDSATFRLNFYSVKDGLPFEKIVEKNIIEKPLLSKGWLTIDLSKYDIRLDQNFFISFEFLPDDKPHNFVYGARISGSVVTRTSSLGNWTKQKGGSVSCYVTVKQ